MKEFALLFRQADAGNTRLDPEKIQSINKKWQDWIGSIAAQGKLSNTGIRLAMEGKVLKPGGVITDGPFVEIKEKLGGFIVVKAEDLDEATTLAHGCPALEHNGSIEIRPFYQE